MKWGSVNCYEETFGPEGTIGRDNRGEVVLVKRLRPVLAKLNPDAPPEAIEKAIEELTRDRSLMSAAAANREVYLLLKDGISVTAQDLKGQPQSFRIRIIDWDKAQNNDFLLCSQLWISGDMYTRRADLVGFVNGLPLVFIELKAAHKNLQTAYTDNLRDYRSTIGQVFWYNGVIILSNGSKSRIGAITSQWEHFSEWKKVASETEKGVIDLETMIRGTCGKERLLDIVENFTLFEEAKGGYIKLVARNHQYLGVSNAIESVKNMGANKGRLGVFWHTQGSGKSYSMIFFAQKILRKMGANWTFVIVTDRDELDGQIYKNFARVGAVREAEAQAGSAADLRQLLREDHRYVFTLIQKFRTPPGQRHPVISERKDIIVITDEAHRSQYDTFALNMRSALPGAAFIGFTGTPLIAGEEKTKDVFGEYVSKYDFKQSVDDEATVPLYYENRIPELQLTNEDLNEEMEAIIEEAELDEQQQRKLEREFRRQYHLITRDDRLEKIAADMVEHFTGRGYKGKAMFVCIDKATAVKMYDKVRKYWKKKTAELKAAANKADGEAKEVLEAKAAYMAETDMAVVVSGGQNEVEDLRAKGVDIVPHRRRMVTEDLDEKFKDPADPFRIVFVCGMWMTGFDVPCCSTIYLDKPMRNHTLMQTIARANRVFADKASGLIVDYVGVFRNLQKALAIYGVGIGGETPVIDKAALVADLKKALAEAERFCGELGVSLEAIEKAQGFARVKLLDDAVDAIVAQDETKKRFLVLVGLAIRLFRAVMPDPVCGELMPRCRLLAVIAEKIQSAVGPVDISAVMQQVEALLDESVAAEAYVIRERPEHERVVDLSKIDFEALKKRFEKSRKHIEAQRLRGLVADKVLAMVLLNKSRVDFLEQFQAMIDEYNAGSMNVDEFFRQLTEFAGKLNEEEKRGLAEELSEEELAVFDLLTRPDMKLSEKEKKEVKKVSRELLATLKEGKLVIDWRKKLEAQAAVQVAIGAALEGLPQKYEKAVFDQKCNLVYQHIYDSYYGEGRSLYAVAG